MLKTGREESQNTTEGSSACSWLKIDVLKASHCAVKGHDVERGFPSDDVLLIVYVKMKEGNCSNTCSRDETDFSCSFEQRQTDADNVGCV